MERSAAIKRTSTRRLRSLESLESRKLMTADMTLGDGASEPPPRESDPVGDFILRSPDFQNLHDEADFEIATEDDTQPNAGRLGGFNMQVQFNPEAVEQEIVDMVFEEPDTRDGDGGDTDPPDCIIWDILGYSG